MASDGIKWNASMDTDVPCARCHFRPIHTIAPNMANVNTHLITRRIFQILHSFPLPARDASAGRRRPVRRSFGEGGSRGYTQKGLTIPNLMHQGPNKSTAGRRD